MRRTFELNLQTRGRAFALAAATAMMVAACGGGASPSPASTAAGTSASPSGSAAAGGPVKVGYLPKDIVNQYFAAAKTGVDKAAVELGGTVVQVGPNEAKPDLQIPFITDLTTQKVSAIIISADGKDEVAPALKDA